MTDLRKAAEMALEALEDMAEFSPSRLERQISTLRQALAQDEQEPVIDRRLKVKIGRQYGYALNEHWFYLQPADEYAEQALTKHSGISVPPKREWVGLTDEERVQAFVGAGLELAYLDYDADMKISKVIEARLREKNT